MSNNEYNMSNLKKIIKEQNKSLTSLAVELEVSQEAISQYISGKIKPKLKTIILMAKTLNTTTDYLLGLTDNPAKPNMILTNRENNLLNSYKSLNNEEKALVDGYVQAILDLKKWVFNYSLFKL